MHIPDGFLDARTCLGTFALAGAGLGLGLRRVHARWTDRTVPLMGVMSAFVFAGQMVNFPIAGGTSGHLQGGVLASAFLGPAGAGVVMATVLFVQCFLFQDGGVTALGANWLNLGWIGAGTGYWLFARIRRSFPGNPGIWLGAALGSWFAVVCAAMACSVELAASKTVPLSVGFPAMTATHGLIGIGEALITAAMVSFIAKVRPDLLFNPAPSSDAISFSGASLKPYFGYGLLLALGIALLISPLASTLPDGLEALAARLHLGHETAPGGQPFAGETGFAGLRMEWLGPSLGAGLGTIVAFGIAWAIGRWLRRSRVEPHAD